MPRAWVRAKIDESQQRTVTVVPEANQQRQLLSRAAKRNPTAQNSFIKWTSNGLVDREFARDSSKRLCQQSSYSCIYATRTQPCTDETKQTTIWCMLSAIKAFVVATLVTKRSFFSSLACKTWAHIYIYRTSSKHECLCVCTIAHYTGPSHATRHLYGKNIQKTYGNANAYVK